MAPLRSITTLADDRDREGICNLLTIGFIRSPDPIFGGMPHFAPVRTPTEILAYHFLTPLLRRETPRRGNSGNSIKRIIAS